MSRQQAWRVTVTRVLARAKVNFIGKFAANFLRNPDGRGR